MRPQGARLHGPGPKLKCRACPAELGAVNQFTGLNYEVCHFVHDHLKHASWMQSKRIGTTAAELAAGAPSDVRAECAMSRGGKNVSLGYFATSPVPNDSLMKRVKDDAHAQAIYHGHDVVQDADVYCLCKPGGRELHLLGFWSMFCFWTPSHKGEGFAVCSRFCVQAA